MRQLSSKATRARRSQRYTQEEYQNRVESLNAKALTVKETSELFKVRMETVREAIASCRLVAVKKDGQEFEKGGFWLIEHKSAIELWAHRISVDEQEND